jgi:hypothetical protein
MSQFVIVPSRYIEGSYIPSGVLSINNSLTGKIRIEHGYGLQSNIVSSTLKFSVNESIVADKTKDNTFTGNLILTPSAGKSGLRLPVLATAPQASAGAVYIDSNTGMLMIHDGITWTGPGGNTVNIGSTVTGATEGSILFARNSSLLAQNNSRLHWEDRTNIIAPTVQPLESLPGEGSLVSGTYYVVVASLDIQGRISEASDEKSINFGSGSTNAFYVTWSAVVGAASYRIYIGISPGSRTYYIGTNNTNYTVQSLSGGSVNLTVGTPPFAFGRMGVNRNSPRYALDVTGTISADQYRTNIVTDANTIMCSDGSGGLVMKSASSLLGQTALLVGGNYLSGNPAYMTLGTMNGTPSQGVQILSNGTARITIGATGGVGVGMLPVAGSVLSVGGLLRVNSFMLPKDNLVVGSVLTATDTLGNAQWLLPASVTAVTKGGNADNASMVLGTTDNFSVTLIANNLPAITVVPQNDSNQRVGINLSDAPTTALDINGNSIRIRSHITSPGTQLTAGRPVGEICWDDQFVYVKTNAGWKKVVLSNL